MAAAVNPEQPRTEADPEKITPQSHVANDYPEKEDESDASSQIKQDGVKQVEAITSIWSPTMMWVVFGLSVNHSLPLFPQRTTRTEQFTACTLSNSSILFFRPFTVVLSLTSPLPSTNTVSSPSPAFSVP